MMVAARHVTTAAGALRATVGNPAARGPQEPAARGPQEPAARGPQESDARVRPKRAAGTRAERPAGTAVRRVAVRLRQAWKFRRASPPTNSTQRSGRSFARFLAI